MATTYQLTITLPASTVQALHQGEFRLYAFQSVQGGGGGRPVPWLALAGYAENNIVTWTDAYGAYTSQGISGTLVSAASNFPIALGQVLEVDDTGNGKVADGGVAGAISVLNQSQAELTTGISLAQDGSFSPLCAFPLYGGNLVVVVPGQQVFLEFSANGPATPANQSLGPGVLVDFSAATERAVSYDIDQGWSWGGEVWATPVPPLTDLAALLVQPLQLGAAQTEASLDATADAVQPADVAAANGAAAEPRPQSAALASDPADG